MKKLMVILIVIVLCCIGIFIGVLCTFFIQSNKIISSINEMKIKNDTHGNGSSKMELYLSSNATMNVSNVIPTINTNVPTLSPTETFSKMDQYIVRNGSDEINVNETERIDDMFIHVLNETNLDSIDDLISDINKTLNEYESNGYNTTQKWRDFLSIIESTNNQTNHGPMNDTSNMFIVSIYSDIIKHRLKQLYIKGFDIQNILHIFRDTFHSIERINDDDITT